MTDTPSTSGWTRWRASRRAGLGSSALLSRSELSGSAGLLAHISLDGALEARCPCSLLPPKWKACRSDPVRRSSRLCAMRLSRLGEADHALGDDGAGGLTAR